MSAQLFQAAMENELIESQMYRDRESQLNKKKRTKVTDTRLSPRNSKSVENVSPSSKDVIDPGKLFDSMSLQFQTYAYQTFFKLPLCDLFKY